MKKNYFLLLMYLFLNIGCVFSQGTGIDYQAIAKNTSGQVLCNQTLTIRFNILSNSSSGTLVFSETHRVRTDYLGSFGVIVGEGSVVSGDFYHLDWNNSHFLKVEFDPSGGNAFVDLDILPIHTVRIVH